VAPSVADHGLHPVSHSGAHIQVAHVHLKECGCDPGPIGGIDTAQTPAAVWAFQRRYGLSVSGLLDHDTRLELVHGLDPVPKQ
jgi:hypothetical protein